MPTCFLCLLLLCLGLSLVDLIDILKRTFFVGPWGEMIQISLGWMRLFVLLSSWRFRSQEGWYSLFDTLNVADWCCMSKSNGKSMDHLLLKCPIARELWDLLLCLFGVYWVMPNSGTAMLASWKGRQASSKVKTQYKRHNGKCNLNNLNGLRLSSSNPKTLENPHILSGKSIRSQSLVIQSLQE